MLNMPLALLLQPVTSLFQDPAPAAPAQASGDSPFTMLVPLVLCGVVFYFFMIAPERKQRKKREELLSAIKKGDRVLTTGGMYATVAAIADGTVTLQIADGVRVRYALSAVGNVISDDDASSEPEKKS
jgi:preprotein translocase subunit YajC